MVVVSNHSLTFNGRVGVGTTFLAHLSGLDLLVCKLKHISHYTVGSQSRATKLERVSGRLIIKDHPYTVLMEPFSYDFATSSW